ncbi:hypothetical protein [Geosporobacter ferrireducens]|uniref:DUF4320 domain-containing protein n=1 Tax=Geosporobacter ferrireducens TaxID=1424294 RepID=A0A1D8GBR1_9FIRM|nr:hypothetical protein [Geosporobacter ferrireducens]AOT68345.1 hypothetical protein Gferi_01295 [Geosporobacter ferrireducens]
MSTIQFLQKVLLFFACMILVVDIGGSIYTKLYYQGGIDFCVKAASMEIVRDDDYARGIIKIDETKSVEEFKKMMGVQFQMAAGQIEERIIYAAPINTVPSEFVHPVTGRAYTILKPMFVAIYRVKRDGIFLKKEILVDNLSGSQVQFRPK